MRASLISRRTWLWIAGVATVALAIVQIALNQRMMDTGGPGIIAFEFAGSEGKAQEILDDWGDDGRDAARLSLWLDFAYLVSYAAFGWLGIRAIRDAARRRGWRRLENFAGPMSVSVLIAAGFDAVENVGLLLALEEIGGGIGSGIAAGCAVFKFQLLAIVLLYLIAAILTWVFSRGRAEPVVTEKPGGEPARSTPTPEPTPEQRSPYEPPPGPPPPGAPEELPSPPEEPPSPPEEPPSPPEERPAERPRRRWIP